MPTKDGKICRISRLIKSDFLKTNLKREKTYALSDAITTVSTAVQSDMISVFLNQSQYWVFVKR